jgi:hypothetical protein
MKEKPLNLQISARNSGSKHKGTKAEVTPTTTHKKHHHVFFPVAAGITRWVPVEEFRAELLET